MSQATGSKGGPAESDDDGNRPIATNSIEATASNAGAPNGPASPIEQSENLHARTNTEPDTSRRELGVDGSHPDAHNAEAAVNAALDTAIEDVANLLNDPSPTDQRAIVKEPAKNEPNVGMQELPQSSNTESQPQEVDKPPTDAASNAAPELVKSGSAAEKNAPPNAEKSQPQKVDKPPTDAASNAAPESDKSGSAAERNAPPKAEIPVVVNTEAVQIPEKSGTGNAEDRDSRNPMRPPDHAQPNEEQSRLSADITRGPQMQSGSSAENRGNAKPEIHVISNPSSSEQASEAKPDKPAVENEEIANESSAAKREMVKRLSSRGKTKNAPKDSPADDGKDGNSETVQDAGDIKDKDGAQTKKKKRQKSKSSRASVDGAAPAVVEDPETAEIKQRIKEFSNGIRSVAAGGKSQTEPVGDQDGNPVITSRRLSADAMEFVPTVSAIGASSQPSISVSAEKDPVPTSVLPSESADAPEFVPTTNSTQPVLTRPKSVKDMISKFDSANSKPETEIKKQDNSARDVESSRQGSRSDESGRKDIQKPQQDVSQTKPSDAPNNLSPNPDPQPSTKPALQDRIKQFQTASQASATKEHDSKSKDQTGNANPPTHRSKKDKAAASLEDINLDVEEEEVLEAPSPSIALVKKPTADPNDRGLHQRARPQPSQQGTGPESNPADSSSNTGSGAAKAFPADPKNQIEKALKTRMTSEPPKPKRPMPFASADPNVSAKVEKPATNQNADLPKQANPDQGQRQKTPQDPKAASNADVGQPSVSDPNKVQQDNKVEVPKEQQDKKVEEPIQAVASKPTGPAVATELAQPQSQAQPSGPNQQSNSQAQKSSSGKSCCVIV